ncbi:peptidase inhibitor family I36 protein [Kitasatospora arboriphila]
MRSFRMLAVATAAVGALAMAAPAAMAAPVPSGSVQQSTGSPDKVPSKPVIATYKGKKIDLSKGWSGAKVCTEVTGGAVYCHDSLAEADKALAAIDPAAAATAEQAPALKNDTVLSPQAIADCSYGWACLFEHSDYSGRMLRWSDSQHQEPQRLVVPGPGQLRLRQPQERWHDGLRRPQLAARPRDQPGQPRLLRLHRHRLRLRRQLERQGRLRQAVAAERLSGSASSRWTPGRNPPGGG